ncbi:MAG: Asp-tRNA(Asn)/Glu-tRNA(Gln) amidotransferase subunit GatC [bacterium]|nr:Asp-tRNA(Asn)/Glu-tRNA(Gln) amidotransferase subunit GatC [bacterium]
MELSKAEVKKIADLARIALTAEEVDKYSKELSTILEFVDQLNELNTDGIEPTSQVTGLVNVWRKDEVNHENTREEMLKSAIETAEDHLKVQGVFNVNEDEEK